MSDEVIDGTVDAPVEGAADPNTPSLPSAPVYEQAIAVAIIVDNEVADILYTNDELSAAFLSAPKFVNVTSLMSDPFLHPAKGWAYDEDSNSFIGRDGSGEPVSLSL